MTVQEFLAALQNPTSIVTILDNDGTELIKLYAAGYAQLLATLLARDVEQVTVGNQNAISLKLTSGT